MSTSPVHPSPTTQRDRKRARRPGLRRDIQGVRALAVVAVVANHLTEWPRGGFVGVDVFFVISGFLITGLLLREHERTGRISFSGFYRRRIKRIFPALVAVVAATLAASWFIFNESRWRATVVDAGWGLLSAANWRFGLQSTDYFQRDRAISPLQHYWSLSVEEQFYFVWPWLLLLVFVLAARSRSWSRHAGTVAGVVLGIVSLGSFGYALQLTRSAPSLAYFSTFSRVWELGVGALLAVLAPALTRLPAALRPMLGWAGLLGIVVSLLVVTPETSFPAPAAAGPVLATALVVAAGTGVAQQRGLFPLTNRVSGYLGDISYSLYLWHFPVIILGVALFGSSPLVTVGLAGAMLAISVYSFHLLEDPVRRSDWLTGSARRRSHRHRRRRSSSREISMAYQLTSLSLLAVVVLALLTVTVLRAPATGQYLSADAAASTAPTRVAKTDRPELASLQTEIGQALTTTQWPKLQPSLADVLRENEAYDDVKLCGSSKRDAAQCEWGDPNAKHTMITVGNSTSAVYSRTLRSVIGTDAGWEIIPFGLYGCPFGDTQVQTPPPDAPDGCAQRADLAVDAINQRKPDVVILSGIMSAEAVLSELRKVTAKVTYVVLPGPPSDKDIGACYSKVSSPADCTSTVPPEWGRRDRAIAQQLRGTFIDSSSWYCVRSKCPAFVGTMLTKADLQHMTVAYSDRIAPVVREALVAAKVLPKAGTKS